MTLHPPFACHLLILSALQRSNEYTPMTDQTSDHVAALATQTVRLDRLLLLGTFGTDTALSALVRLPSGETRVIRKGDRLEGREVLAVDAQRALLAPNTVLRLPEA